MTHLVYLLKAGLGSFQYDPPLYPLDNFRVLQAAIRHFAAREHLPHKYSVCPHVRFRAETRVVQHFWRRPLDGKFRAATAGVLIIENVPVNYIRVIFGLF